MPTILARHHLPSFVRDGKSVGIVIYAAKIRTVLTHEVRRLALDVRVMTLGLNSRVVTFGLIQVDQSRFIIFVRKHGFPLDKFTYLKYIYVPR